MVKKVPKFWWDFDDDYIIVESDIPGYEVISKFVITKDNVMAQINNAEQLIKDLESGRKSIKDVK